MPDINPSIINSPQMPLTQATGVDKTTSAQISSSQIPANDSGSGDLPITEKCVHVVNEVNQGGSLIKELFDAVENTENKLSKNGEQVYKELQTKLNSNEGEFIEAFTNFVNNMDSMDQKDAAVIVGRLLKECAFHHPQSYQQVLDKIRDKFPSLDDTIHRFKEGDTHRDVITPSGMRVLVDLLEKRGKVPEGYIEVIADYGGQDLEERLSQKLGEIQEGEKCAVICMLAKGKGMHESVHYVPLMIEKHEGKISVVITDSLGDSKTTYAPLMAEVASMMLQEKDVDFSITIASPKRQHDEMSCPVFALRDAVQFYNTSDAAFFENQKDKKADESDPHIHWVHTLPPSMMKVTQSLSSIAQYDKSQNVVNEQPETSLSTDDAGSAQDKKGLKEVFNQNMSVRDSVQKHIRKTLTGKEYNRLTEDRLEKYQRLLYTVAIHEMLYPHA